MSDDRELLKIAELAIHEHSVWRRRIECKRAYQAALHAYAAETGEQFDMLQINDLNDESAEQINNLRFAAQEARSKLNIARSATRRAIVRAELGKVKV